MKASVTNGGFEKREWVLERAGRIIPWTHFTCFHDLSNSVVPAGSCCRPAGWRLLAAALHAGATRAVFQPARAFCLCADRLADIATAQTGALLGPMQFALLALLFASAASLVWVPVLALFGVVQIAISGLVVLLIVYVIMSWVQTESPVALVVERLCKPLLAPLRRRLPLIGGIDVAPLVALVLLQIAAMVLASLQRSLLLG